MSGSSSGTQTALIVVVPETESLVRAFRRRHDPASAEGVPAHVTVLYPFLPPPRVSTDVIQALRIVFSKLPNFQAEFSEIRKFPGVLYLAPSEEAPFRRLTEHVVARFPETPPYSGQFSDVVPHLTVAHADSPAQLDDIAGQFAAAAKGRLPIHAAVRDVVLIEKRNERWATRTRFPLDVRVAPGI
jgi:2'-5' RNA ligase